MLATNDQLAYRDNGVIRVAPHAKEDVKKAVLSFIDTISTSTGRSTFYNDKAEQLAALNAVHNAVFSINRGLYAAMLTIPGVLDISIQNGISLLLSDHNGKDWSFIDHKQEDLIISNLLAKLPATRLLRLFVAVREKRINNERTRRIIRNIIIGSNKLPLWSIKYKSKLRTILTHVWGVRVANSIRKIAQFHVSNPRLTIDLRARDMLSKYLYPYLGDNSADTALECINFIYNGKAQYKNNLLNAYYEARNDLKLGSVLPTEILEGIRSRFHASSDAGKVLELTSRTMTEGQKLARQAQAKRNNVKIEFNPLSQDIVKLYVYCLETGQITDDIKNALKQKSLDIARTYPLKYNDIGIVLDASASMYGVDEQKYRPLAISLAMRDIISATASGIVNVSVASGSNINNELVKPSGDTSLAEALLDVAEHSPDAIYVITDGYENAPSGRLDEVIRAMRDIGITIPIYQITPVMAAEKVGIRPLSPLIAPLPVSSPEGIGLSMIRAAINDDIEHGILHLLNMTAPQLGSDNV